MSMIQVKNLTKRFDDLLAVNHVSFEIEAGKAYGFVGPNGAGKTTTMRIMATIEEPTSGDVLIDGYSVLCDPEKVRAVMGFMPDQYETYPNMTVLEFMDFYARAYGLPRKTRQKNLASIMDFTGLTALASKEVNTLSKGMRQRLCLGKTLIHDPKVLLMDEPAAGLDPHARIEFRELVTALRDQGKTFLISSHILTELEEFVDGVAIIEQGNLLANGSVEQIRQSLIQSNNSKRKIEVLFLGEAGPLEKMLLESPFVSGVQVSERMASFEFDGQAEAQADLLTRLCSGNIRILEFRGRAQDLESIFLSVTRGKVQ